MHKAPFRILTVIFTAVLLIMTAFCLFACESDSEEIDLDAVTEFATALSNLDFDTAHTYFWKYAEYERLDTFKEVYSGIVSALKLKNVTFKSLRVEDGMLKYTAVLDSELAGEIEQEISTHIVLQNGETYIEYSRALFLSELSKDDTLYVSSSRGKRGEVLTSDGVAAAKNDWSDTVYIKLSEAGDDISYTLSRISGVVELSADDIKKATANYETAVKKNYADSIVAAYQKDSIDPDTEQALLAIDGVHVNRDSMTPQRWYPYANVFSHAVGYASSPSEDEQKELDAGGYSASSIYGHTGIEAAYNDHLLAKDGKTVSIKDASGSTKAVLYEKPAVSGSDIILTLESDAQQLAYYALQQYLSESQSGVAVTLDPYTGEVKSMVSFPSFDPNLFNFSISSAEYDAMFTDPAMSSPLFSRATQGLYPPGSVIKPFVAAAALEAGVIKSGTEFPYTIVNNEWRPEGWKDKTVTRNTDSGTPLVLKNALSKSDNIYFSWVGMNMGDVLFDSLERAGIGSAFGFDMPLAVSNLKNKETSLTPVVYADTAIGHADLLVTPLQIAAMYTAFANEGDILSPYIVKGIYKTEGHSYSEEYAGSVSTAIDGALSASSVRTVREGLRAVVTEGTAKSLNTEGRTVYAKTGTALKSEYTDQRISWICAWTEDDDANLVLVLIDGPEAEDSVKFDIAKLLL